MSSNKRKWIIPGVLTVVLGTAGSLFLNQSNIETDLISRSQTLLTSNNLSWAEVEFDARDAIISGIANNEEEQQKAQRLLKNLPGVRAVNSGIELLPTASPYFWSARKTKDGMISLTGFTPNEDIYNNLKNVAGVSSFDKALAQGAPNNFEETALAGIDVLSLLEEGKITHDENGWSLEGNASSKEDLEIIKSKLDNSVWKVVASAPEPPPPPPPPPEPEIPTAIPYLWSAEKSNDGIYILSGYVPQESLKHYFLLKTGSLTKDNLEIAMGEPKNFSKNAKSGLVALEGLEAGRVTYNGTQWALVGSAISQNKREELLNNLNNLVDISTWSIDIDAPIPVASASYRFVATKTVDGDIFLNGDVPTKEVKKLAGKVAYNASTDNLNIDSPAPSGFNSAMVSGIRALNMLENGQLSFRSKSWFLSGLAKDEEIKEKILSVITDIDENNSWNVNLKLPEPEPEPEPIPVASEKYRFVATKPLEGEIVLNGNIPTIELQNYVGILAGRVSTDNLTIDYPAPDDFKRSLFAGLRSLKMLENGQLSFRSKSWFLTGLAKDEEIKEKVLSEIADIDENNSWNVNLKLPEPEPVTPEPEPEPEPVAPEPAPVAKANYRFVATLKEGKGITLNGNIPTIELQNYAGILAGKVPTDNLTIDYPAPDDFKRSLFAGLRSLKMLENGQLSFRSKKWYLVGEATSEEIRDNALSMISSLPNANIWSANITIKSNLADECNANVATFAQNNAILFDVGKAIIKPQSDIILQHLALLLNKCPTTDVHVQGHTDSDGSEARNLTLSVDRAEAVVKALVERGINSDRMFAIGYGETLPIDTNDTVQGKSKNRRTVFSVYKKTN